MQTAEQKQQKLNALIDGLAADLKEEVARIEASPETTQYHYQDYGRIINATAQGRKSVAKVIALALIQAGANRLGVSNAVKLFT